MAKEFYFEARYAETVSMLQAEIDRCRETLHRYAKQPNANRELIMQKSAHIKTLDSVMAFLLRMTGAITPEMFGQTERFVRQLREDPQLTEGHVVFRKATRQSPLALPSYLTVPLKQINVDPCTFL